MPKFDPKPFEPPFWLTNAHLQTILPKLLAKKAPIYRRELIEDSFGTNKVAYDFLDAETTSEIITSKTTTSEIKASKNQKYQTPLLVLFHGLEGSSQSHYASILAHQTHQLGWHFVTPHYRTCGGIKMTGDVFYNAGDTVEIHHMLQTLSQRYQTIYALGVSLGGNMLAKYMGEYGDDALCERAVIASAPVDLASASIAMEKFVAKNLYIPYLLNPLVEKALSVYLTNHELNAIKASKNIYQFDHLFTAKRHGFRSVNDYYRKASALPHLINISKPTLIITAKDDPFLGVTAQPEDVSDAVTLLDTKYGGHIGFIRYVSKTKNKSVNLTWLSDTALEFFQL